MLNFSSLPPLGLYIHLPWCIQKCPYCDFNSHISKDRDLPQEPYIQSLLDDLDQELPQLWGRPLHTVFIGGGTPSLFSAEQLDQLLSSIRARLPLHPAAEITLEANPGAIEANKFSEFLALGITRLSIGVQSFNDALLKRIGRIHDSNDACRAIEFAQKAGFTNLNLDLMFGLPGQTIHDARSDIQCALSFSPNHLSHYQLTIEPNTLFQQQPPSLPDEEAIWQMQNESTALITEHGYRHYEISGYAQRAAECRHNLNYWQFGDYVGIGAGAHSKITNANEQSITRSWKQKHPDEYMAKAATPARIAGQHQLKREEIPLEFMLNTMRLSSGVPSHYFSERCGLPISTIQQALDEAVKRGFIVWDLERLQPTALGQRFLNDLLAIFNP